MARSKQVPILKLLPQSIPVFFIVVCFCMAFVLAYPVTTIAIVLLVIITVASLIAWRLKQDRALEERYLRSGIEQIDQMSGKEFERRLAVHFSYCGWHVQLTSDTGDYGADLVGENDHGGTVVIQAKRYKKNIGVRAVQEVNSAKTYYGAEQAIVITNQYFSKNAKELARRCSVELWDRERLIRALVEVNNRLPS
ncbi:restriction endonuclease [Geomicrobium sp. JCM 19038]|uniref:restriction endonuclease n=1 Tax=Geomicrobium sp. JCM 19038 TaxID=1460635 RepID=UPI00045F2097|nr:restriction endonuclease [Geomicrobium sp. JCM 19038]GAK08350.1 hypothetical protein JCM19038_2132 [Geomicrobium sp. JCM 19038]